MGLHRLAVELGKTKGELLDQLTFSEYRDWIQYWQQINPPKEEEVGTMENPEEVDWSKADLGAIFGGGS